MPSVRKDGTKQLNDDKTGRVEATKVEEEDNSSNREQTINDERVIGKEREKTEITVRSPSAPSKVSKKTDVDRSVSVYEGEYKKAIVEVFDRVNTPELASAAISDEQTAFSVLPDNEKVCECPDCRTKPMKKSSTSERFYNINFFKFFYSIKNLLPRTVHLCYK